MIMIWLTAQNGINDWLLKMFGKRTGIVIELDEYKKPSVEKPTAVVITT